MNILFLTPRDSKKNLGGVEGHVRILTEELERRGHEVKEISLEVGATKVNARQLPWSHVCDSGSGLGYFVSSKIWRGGIYGTSGICSNGRM